MVDTHAPDISDKLEALLAREQDPFTAQDILLEVVNGIRFRAFDKVLTLPFPTLPYPTLLSLILPHPIP